ncbi:MAG TPA: phosphoglycerate kinase [Chlamydiales bacterium]|nr:phosphoglycerate kinase [Chlamydiales bacterium]
MQIPTIKDLDLKNEKVIMRVDFNVPLKDGKIIDDSRIQAALESIQYVLEKKASLILMSHLGRPKGKYDPSLSLNPIAKRLSELLNQPVYMAPDCIGKDTQDMKNDLKPGEILLLENLRFHEAETKPEKDPSFAKSLSEHATIYINDAFGTAHRKHSSTYEIVQYFPKKAALGFLFEKELQYLSQLVDHPKKPFYAIIGGAKISSKIGVLKNLIPKVSALFIGGGMSYTFLKAKNIPIGRSIVEDDFIDTAKEIMQECEKQNIPLYLPQDIVTSDDFSNDGNIEIINAHEGISNNFEGMDIGPITADDWSLKLDDGHLIFWNGPLGVYELDKFQTGTEAIAQTLSKINGTTIVGGGDSVAAIHKLHLEDNFSHLSTGGGASLEFIENGSLPAIDILKEK